MFRSLTDSLRSLWYRRTDETAQITGRKRKRPVNEGDQDSDVEVVSVKLAKQEDHSSSGLLSFLHVPMSKMSEWVRNKTVRQDHFFVRPIPKDSHWNRRSHTDRDPPLPQSISAALDTRNGAFGHPGSLEADIISRPPIHSQNGAHRNGVTGAGDTKGEQSKEQNMSLSASQQSTCNMTRPGSGKVKTVDRCFHLKEREEYRKLLQQYTTLDLGYHSNTQKADNSHSASSRYTHQQKKPGTYLPLHTTSSNLSSTSLRNSSHSSSHVPHPNHILRVTPSRFTSSVFSRKTVDEPASSSSSVSSSVDGWSVPRRRPGRALQVFSSTDHHGQIERRFGSQRPTAHTEQRMVERGVTARAAPAFPTQPSTGDVPSSSIHTRLKETVTLDDDRINLTLGSEVKGQSTEKPVSRDEQKPAAQGESTSSACLDSVPKFKSSQFLDEEWLTKLNSKYSALELERRQLIEEAEMKKKILEERRECRMANLDKKLKHQLKLWEEEPEVIEEIPLPEVPQEKPLPELTDSMLREVRAALDTGPPNQVLSEGFRLQLTRADIATLRGLNWLNDEVINFYMNMLMERGEQEGFSKTYACNTFFYPKLLNGGHSAVKRWTRKVDVFAHTYLIIPVHLGVHWCLCMVFMSDKKICYYDSMGGNNNQCLNAVRQYLADESQQKKNVALDLSQWSTEIVKDIPQQMNGSDCGMFTCMYAETLTRGEPITFTQKDMPYFRRRMVYEILKKKIL